MKKGTKPNLSDTERERRRQNMSTVRSKRLPSTYNTWTSEEVKVCLMLIKDNPDNLRHSFRLASEKINRTPEAIAYQYYNKDGAIYRHRRGRYLFSLFSFSSFVEKLIPKKVFGVQVKNNLEKGKKSLK